jgi:pimeloyl-ACP methyl ester carboxylesterase
MWPAPKKLQLNQDYESNPLAGLSSQSDKALTRGESSAYSARCSRRFAAGGEPYADLKKITQPVLVTNGKHDIMIPTVNSFTLRAHLPNAQLIIYPDSGHGALFQHAVAYTSHVSEFLARSDALVV